MSEGSKASEWAATVRRIATARPWVSVAAGVVVVAAVVSGVLLGRGSDSASATGVRTTSSLVAAATGTVKQSVSVTGTLTPADEEDLSFGSAAKVTSVRVAQGDKVTKGEVLGTIDTTSLKATLAQARATLAQAKATLATAEDSSDTTDAQLASDKASVTDATSQVTSAQAALTAGTLTSPIAGTVAEVNATLGETASGSSTSSTGGSTGGGTGTGGTGSGTGSGTTTTSSSTADFVVVGMKSWTISASVDDTEVGLLAKGDQAQITTDNVTGTVFGTVTSVSVLSSSTSGSATYPVTIAVTGSPTGLHDGASATVSIVYKQVTNVLTVPTAAVHTQDGASYVTVSTNGTKKQTTVQVGIAAGGTTQITSGLTAGQQVVVETVTRTGGTGTGGTGTGTGTGGTGTTRGGTGGFGGGGTGGYGGGGTGGYGGGTGGGGFLGGAGGGQQP